MNDGMLKSSLISVIVPVYNVEGCLHYCLDSIINQTYDNIEILLIDDGSTDSSGKICDEYERKDKRFVVLHQDNSGVSAARNTGIDIAKGDYVYFVDSDDYIHQQTLEILYDAINKGNYAFAMGFERQVYYYDVSAQIGSLNYEIISQNILIERMCDHSIEHWHYAMATNKLLPMKLIDKERFFDIVAEDLDFNIRLYLKLDRIVAVNQNLYFWVQRKGSLSHQTNFYIESVKSYYLAYSRIPKSEKRYKAYFLWDLHKRLLTAIHISKHTDIEVYTKRLVSDIKNKIWRDFISNKYVGNKKKFVIFIFINVPLLYSFFIWASNNFNVKKIASKINK